MGKGRGLVALCLMLGAAIFAWSPAQGQAQFDLNAAKRQAAESMRWIVVQILAKASNGGGRQSGFGIIVGSMRGRVTIATPKHLVWGDSENERYDDTPEVIFYDQPDLPLTGHREKAFDSVADLAVVTVDTPRSISAKNVYTASIKTTPLNAEVWNIGRAGQWLVSPTPGYYKGTADAAPFVQIDGLPTLPAPRAARSPSEQISLEWSAAISAVRVSSLGSCLPRRSLQN